MPKQENVQFFNSESSFDSESSIGGSRYFDLTNQIVEQAQTIFHTLRRQFLPTAELTNFDKVDYLANRAKILSRDTTPDHLLYLTKIEAPRESRDICQSCVQRLQKFIKDYQGLKYGTMIHKQFYNIYGKGQDNVLLFKKNNQKTGHYNGIKDGQINAVLQPDVESIGEIKSSRARTPQQRPTQRHYTAQSFHSSKQVIELQQQIVGLKRRQSQIRKQFEYLMTTEKLNCEKRVNLFLKVLNKQNEGPYSTLLQDNYKNETIRLGEEIQTVLRQKQQEIQRNSRLQNRILQLQRLSQSLRQELIGYRRLQNSRMQDEQQLNRSFQSQQNNSGDDSRDLRKLTLQIKKLTSQRDILRSQLAKERESIQKQSFAKHSDQSRQLARLKSYLETRNKENEELHRELDKSRVEVIQARQENKMLNKNITTMRDVNDERKRTQGHLDNSNGMENSIMMGENNAYKVGNFVTFKSRLDNSKTLEKSLVSSTKPNSFEQYHGEGIEGHPYYELLPKEFRVRFRRACLRSKQLLFKSNGLEIGVITEFISINIIKVLIHVTNSSQHDIKAMKIKVMNPNDNKTQCEIEEVGLLQSNQQVKLPVTCIIKNYPIGPVVLAMDYLADEKYDVRLLLPVHIFKCVSIEPRDEKFYNPTKVVIKVEKKICKDFTALKEYLCCDNEREIKVKIKHQHSGSIMFLNAKLLKDDIQLEYEHVTGTQKFTEYFVKTFKALLQKQA